MDGLALNISWEYFLGMIGSLIAIAYYANGRFTRLETNYEWLADALRELTITAQNISARAFDAGSPITLTPAGIRLLEQSGLKSYIEHQREDLVGQLQVSAPFDLYKVQDSAFRLFARISLDEPFFHRLNKFAFNNGIGIDLLRRIGAVYLRDIAVAPN